MRIPAPPIRKIDGVMSRKAVVLVSGGLDSAVTLFYARKLGYACFAVTFDYGQRNRIETDSARKVAAAAGAHFHIVRLRFPWKASSLTDRNMAVPMNRTLSQIKSGIPSTYVPARNTVFLSIAASYAEAIAAERVFIGAHSEDSSGYPDCRPEYLRAFAEAVRLGTRSGLHGKLKLEYPLIKKTKRGIIELGRSLGVPFQLTRSCYQSGKRPCGGCDSCILRAAGFKAAGLKDPAMR
jgi:7-cyano-7-deazaguanine synthase